MEERTRTVVPAAPGWYVAKLIEAGKSTDGRFP